MSRPVFVRANDAPMILELLDYAERLAPGAPCAFLRGLAIGAMMAPAAQAAQRQDPRREPERHDTDPTTPIARVALTRKEPSR